MKPLLPSGPTAARWLRRAVVAIAAAYLLVLPQFSTKAAFLAGPSGVPGPLMVVTLGLGLWLMPVLLMASWVAGGSVRLPHPAVAVPAVLFVAGAAISTAAASDKAAALVRSAQMTGLWVGAFALAQAVWEEGERRFLLAALVAAGAVSAAVAVQQATVGLPKAYAFFEAHREEVLASQGIEPGSWQEEMFRGRFFGGVQAAMGHPNVLAAMLTLALFAALGLGCEKWMEARAPGARALAAVVFLAAALCAVGICLTQSRAAIAAAAVGVYWFGVARRVRRRRLRLTLYLLPLAVAAVGLALATRIDHPAVREALTTLRYRLDYWRATFGILARHWETGVGFENFRHHYIQHKVPWAPEDVTDPHNMLLATWSKVGLAGLVALVLLWATAVRVWRRRGGRLWPSRDPKVAGTHEEQRASGEGESLPDGRTPHLTVAARTSRLEDAEVQRGTALPGLLVPTVALGGPVVFWFLAAFFGGVRSTHGLLWGMGGVAGMAILLGLAPAERPKRLEAAGRPMDRLYAAVVAGLVVFALQEQVGTATLAPPTAWAMLVLLVATLGPAPDRARRGGGRISPSAGAPDGEGELPVPARAGRPIGLGTRFGLILVAMAACFAYARFLVVPVAQERRLLKLALAGGGEARSAEAPARAAADAFPLAWEPAFLRGRLWHQQAERGEGPRAAIQLERALDGYRAALRRHPRLLAAYRAMADVHLAMPHAEQDPALLAAARRCLEQAARLYPTHIPTRLRLAEILDRLGKRRGALAAYREVLRLDEMMPMRGRGLSKEARAKVAQRVVELGGSRPPPVDAEDAPGPNNP